MIRFNLIGSWSRRKYTSKGLLPPRLAPVVLHRVIALGLGHIPARLADPENLRGPPGLGGVVVPRAASAVILELDHGVVGARRRRRGETKRQNANPKYQTFHCQLPVAPFSGNV